MINSQTLLATLSLLMGIISTTKVCCCSPLKRICICFATASSASWGLSASFLTWAQGLWLDNISRQGASILFERAFHDSMWLHCLHPVRVDEIVVSWLQILHWLAMHLLIEVGLIAICVNVHHLVVAVSPVMHSERSHPQMYLSSCHSCYALAWIGMRCLLIVFFYVLVAKSRGQPLIYLELGTTLSTSPLPLWWSRWLAQDPLNWGWGSSVCCCVIKARVLRLFTTATLTGLARFVRWTPRVFLLFSLCLREP